MSNPIRKTYKADDTFVAPAGVTSVQLRLVLDNIQQVVAANDSCVALDFSGNAFSWGGNGFGQLGDNTTTNRSSPVSVLGGRVFRQVSGDTGTTFFIETSTGNAYGTGRAQFGELGDNTTTNKSSQILLVGGRKYRNVGTGGNAHSVFVQTDGQALCCGFNGDGRLGDNTITDKSSPTLVAGGRKFRQVVAGDSASAGVLGNGDVYTWGGNTAGILGDNTTSNRSSPTLVVGGYKFVSINCSGSFMTGLTVDGNAMCWGDNSQGNLGDNTGVNRSSPVLVVGGHKFIQVSGGNANGFGLKADGSLWGWGANNNGQIGDNTTTNRSSPVLVVGGHNIVQMFKGSSSHSAATRADGAVLTWGANSSGQLGDNTTTNRSSPVVVVGLNVFKNVNSEMLNKTSVAVVPGTSYPITIFNNTISFGGTALGPFFGAIKLEVEYRA